MSLAAILVAVGAAIMLLLGLANVFLTWKDERRPRVFAPRDPNLLNAMQEAPLRLAPTTTIWRAGLGFHYSHSLGLIGFGGLFLLLSLLDWPWLAGKPVLLWAGPVWAAIYALLSFRYWFRVPLAGSSVALALFLGGAVLA